MLLASPVPAQQKIPELASMERQVFNAINQVRKEHDLKPLRWNTGAAQAARTHSANMAARGFFSHDDPEAGGLTERLNTAHIPWMACAENIFMQKGYRDPVQIAVKSWMDSPGHRANILDGEYTYAGLGIARGANGKLYYTQDFFRPTREAEKDLKDELSDQDTEAGPAPSSVERDVFVAPLKSTYAAKEPVVLQFEGFPGGRSDTILVIRRGRAAGKRVQRFSTERKKDGQLTLHGLAPGAYEVRGVFGSSDPESDTDTERFTVKDKSVPKEPVGD